LGRGEVPIGAKPLESYPPMAYATRLELHTVVETPEFVAGARRVLTKAERVALINFVAENPTAGDMMQGTGGARKLRWDARGKGKSGGARVITYYAGPDIPVFLMAIFGKGEKANLSKAERNELRDVLASIATAYRKG
jgi:hypothetical protein